MPEPAVQAALLDHQFMIDFLLVVFRLFIVLSAMLVILSTVLAFHLLTCIDMPVLLVGMLIVLMVVVNFVVMRRLDGNGPGEGTMST